MNCVVEKTRRKTEASIAEAANAIGIPRKLIDVRHGKQIQLTISCTIVSFTDQLSFLQFTFLMRGVTCSVDDKVMPPHCIIC